MGKRKRKNYTDDFKREAVQLVSEYGYKIPEDARNARVHERVHSHLGFQSPLEFEKQWQLEKVA